MKFMEEVLNYTPEKDRVDKEEKPKMELCPILEDPNAFYSLIEAAVTLQKRN